MKTIEYLLKELERDIKFCKRRGRNGRNVDEALFTLKKLKESIKKQING